MTRPSQAAAKGLTPPKKKAPKKIKLKVYKPSEIKLGPFTYKVYWDEESWTRVPHQEDQIGSSNHFTHEIFIRPGLAAAESQATLVHEALHAIMWLAGVDLTSISGSAEEREELLIKGITPWLYMLLSGNPQLLDYMSPRS